MTPKEKENPGFFAKKNPGSFNQISPEKSQLRFKCLIE